MLLELAALLSLLIWAVLLLGRGRFWQLVMLNDPAPAAPSNATLAVIVPARNEAETLPETLPTLLAQGAPVYLVDDMSEDGTADLAQRLAASSATPLHLLHSTPRAGWKGKLSAMQTGWEAIVASGVLPEYVLCTDADIAYDAQVVATLLAKAQREDLSLLSLMVKLRCESTAERFLVPAFVYFFAMLYPFRLATDPETSVAAAAGGCMVLRSSVLQAMGGFAPIKQALIDDCALAREVKARGKIWLGCTTQVKSVRAYARFADIRDMVARTAYDQLRYSPVMLLGTIAGMVLTFAAPVVAAVMGTGLARDAGLVTWGIMALSFLPVARLYQRSILDGIGLPLIALFYLESTIASAWRYTTGRGGQWKGRVQAARMAT